MKQSVLKLRLEKWCIFGFNLAGPAAVGIGVELCRLCKSSSGSYHAMLSLRGCGESWGLRQLPPVPLVITGVTLGVKISFAAGVWFFLCGSSKCPRREFVFVFFFFVPLLVITGVTFGVETCFVPGLWFLSLLKCVLACSFLDANFQVTFSTHSYDFGHGSVHFWHPEL